jgi:hypothetical protein
MQINRTWAALKRALRPSRIARSVSAVLVLTLIQTIALPIMDVGTPKASASTLYDNRNDFQQYTSWQGVNYNHTPYQSSAGTTPISSNDSVINLTQNVGAQNGFLWNTQTYSYASDFSVNASYYFGNDPNGADMIVFYMRPIAEWPNDGVAGSSTGGVNFWSNGEIRAIFDTYKNGTEMTNDHLTVQAVTLGGSTTTYTYTNGEIGVPFKDTAGNTVADVENDAFYDYTIRWTAATRTFAVYAGSSANFLLYSTVISTSELDATSFSFGWAAFTGGAANYHAVKNVNYHVGPTNLTTNTTDLSVVDGTSVTWTSSYTATEGTPTTRWEYSTDGGSSWTSTGETGNTFTFSATRSMTLRKYRFFISTTGAGVTYSRTSTPVTLTVLPPILRSETDTALTTSGTKYATLSNSSPLIPGTVSTMTLQAWVKPTTTCDGAVACSIISVNNSYLVQVLNGKIRYYIGSGSAWCDGGVGKVPADAFVPGNRWSHITFVRVNTNVKIYINGQLRSDLNSACSPTTQAANSNAFFIGVKAANTEAFSGSIDEVRMWSTDRSANAASDMHSNETSTSGLLNYWNFNEGTGTVAYNDAVGALATTDLAITDASAWDANVVSEAVVGSVYTTRTFYRSYITEFGGWKVPSTVSMASTLVIAGGGGGGSRVGGGGGAGGFAYIPKVLLTPNSVELIQVGQGGFGAQRPLVDEWRGQNGQSSFFGTKVRTVGGGGGAGYDKAANNVEHDGKSGGSGGGASAYSTSGGSGTPGASTQVSTYGYGSGNSGGSGSGLGDYPAGGGGGAGGSGFSAANNSTAAAGGAGIVDPIGGTNLCYAAGGGGGIGLGASGAAGAAGSCGAGTTTTASAGTKGRLIPADATANSGSGGGGAGYQSGSDADVAGGAGGSGVIIIRWITALKPTYTKPVNAYLNVGMTETFTTNVAQDSATAILTRTFRWESTTGGSNGTFSLLKQGTGAANASFSWVPTDTSTSGSNYLYRLIVTDSDTAGLFITDSSTAFAVINRTLAMTGATRINKAINVSRSETFTITFGTPVYNATLSPVISGITLDTATASSPVIRIAETATVGTYYETLTVTDSVSASVSIPLTINILPPPTLLNTGEIVSNDLVFHLEAGNSASLIGESGTATTGITWRDISGSKLTAATGAGVNTGAASNTTCTAPTYTSANGGSLNFTSGSDNCYYTSGYTGRNLMTGYTAEAWFKTSATLPDNTAIITQATPFSNVPTYIYIGNFTSNGLVVGFYDNFATAWRFANCAYTPVVGAWTHIAGTYDGTTLTTYINGISQCSATASNTSNTVNIQGLLIGKGVTGATNTTFPGSIASVRIYKSALTAAQIQANFNATRFRFDSSNNTAITPTKKYGNTLLETFTATSGSDTRTITFSVGDRSGIDWDTTTVASQVRLTLQESLTVGSFIDTVTVTDALGQSTYLPLRMTTTKADSFTITMSAPTVITYNGSPITVFPRPTVTGLKWTDTATAVSRFSSALYTESTAAPTNADTYTVRGNTPTFTLGSLDNYLGVIYETSTATVNKANQRPLNVFMYGGVVGSSYLIWLQGGDGTGAVTETLTGVSSLSGCAISNRFLTASEQKQGYCEVRVVKAGDQNYFAETQTVQLYFMAYINNQPTGQVGSGSGIGLNGATSLETSTVQPPSITSLSTLTISLSGGGTLTITGTGFTGTVTVKFWRNKTIDKTSGNGTSISVSASELSSIGATTGRVSVITSAGQAVSVDSLTITP